MKNQVLKKTRNTLPRNGIGYAPTLLIVGPVEDDDATSSMFDQFGWRTHRVKNCLEFLLHIHGGPPRVVVCERDLPDGDWRDVLEATASLQGPPPRVIVTSRLADDHLWAEVLNLGGYDVLAKPLDRREVARSMSLAWGYEQAGRTRLSAPQILSTGGW